jgi:hypothetical protein
MDEVTWPAPSPRGASWGLSDRIVSENSGLRQCLLLVFGEGNSSETCSTHSIRFQQKLSHDIEYSI